MAAIARDLHATHEYLADFVESGGKAELPIDYRIETGVPMETFHHALFARLAELRIDLRLEMIVGSSWGG